MTLAPGTKLDRYEIRSQLGAGGMGEVYLAEDTKLDRRVALKILPAAFAEDQGRMGRFVREAKSVSALNHPNILTIHEIGEGSGHHYIATEFIAGETLRTLIDRGPLPIGESLEIACQIAAALNAAHQAGIIHRDIKPENVMIRADGLVKVLDFGLAKLTANAATDPESETRIQSETQPGMIMGTVAYMSPQQARGQAVDARTDVWSLGVVIYEMLSGRQPFTGETMTDTLANILHREPKPMNAGPTELAQIVSKTLAKDIDARYQKIRDVVADLKSLQRRLEFEAELERTSSPDTKAEAQTRMIASSTTPEPFPGATADSGAARADEGFWVAVLPFKYRGANADLEALAEGLSEDIVTGLSRFSYLKVISRSSTSRYAHEAIDVRSAGKEIGARYVMEGSLRQAGSVLRVSVQLVDASTGAHLWAETYDRPFRAEDIFALQDDLVPRIVSTVADWYGVLPHSMSEALRSKGPEELSPYEAVLRSFGYYERITVEEHAAVRAGLERAVQQAPANADGWAMLSMIYGEEHRFGFNAQPDPLGRALQAARRAADAAPSNHFAYLALAQALYFRKEFQAFRSAAERAIALNPMDGSTLAYMGHLMAFSGDWEHGCDLTERAMQLNPHHPEWYWFVSCLDAYRKSDYRSALASALKHNMPGVSLYYVAVAASSAQLGETQGGRDAVRELLVLKPDYASIAREELGKWYRPELVEHLMDGLRKAGLETPPLGADPSTSPPAVAGGGDVASAASSSSAQPEPAAVAIAVLPFSDMSPAKDQEYLCEGMAEEIMNALVRIDGIRVASRTSAFRARRDGGDLPAIARALSVNHVLEGSVRTAGSRLRVTAQLTEVASGYHLWSERFDREAADVFAVQDEIAAGVVEAVKARLTPGTATIHARPRARNLEAYRSYLKGRHLRYAREDHGGAIRAFEEAIRLDPTHAPSWTGLAESTALAANFGAIPAREACAAARKALATAVGLEGESADSLHGEGWLALIERRWPAMEAAWRRAIELQPTHALALGSFGISLCIRQKLDEGFRLLERAREADPLASFPYMLTGFALLCSGRPQEAQRYAEDALSFEKEDASALFCSSMAKVALENFEEGIATAEHAVAVSQRGASFLGVLGWALATAGRKGEARTLLEELRARPAAAPTIVSEAWLLGALGELDAAFDVLARAEEECQAFLYYTGLPGFDPLRADSRFEALLARLGLTQ